MSTPSAATHQKLEDLARSAAHPAAVGEIRRLLLEGGEIDCYKVNAFRLAGALAIPRAEAVRALLFATQLGLFDLHWDIRCPSCTGTPDYKRALMALQNGVHCGLCDLSWELDFEEQVEVTFTANPDVRTIAFKDFRDRVFPEHQEYFDKVSAREGRVPFGRARATPDKVGVMEVELVPGEYHYELAGKPELGGALVCAGPRVSEVQRAEVTVDLRGDVQPKRLAFAPGPMALTVRHGFPKPWPLLLHHEAPLKNWVSAAYVTSQQDFRDLFSGEFLAPGVSFAVRSTTLMFTDIRGSTEMYERLGDARAYALVQDHFRVITEEIRRHEGGIVKTIGDAVMAAFPVNRDAVTAACAIQSRFAAEQGPAGIEVKIGLHRGPTIAVTSNRALDYFGRTVNVAARVQGQARPRGVMMSEAVLADPSVRALLEAQGWPAETRRTSLKGVSGEAVLTSITLP